MAIVVKKWVDTHLQKHINKNDNYLIRIQIGVDVSCSVKKLILR